MTRCARAEQLGSPTAAPCLRAWAPIALALVLLGIAGQASVAQAQEAALVQEAPPAPAIDPDQLQGLVTTLEDPAARERFVAQLKALIASGKAAEPAGQAELEALGIDFAAELGARMHVFAASIARVALAMVDVPDMWRWLVAQAEAGTRNYWYEVVGKFTAVLLLGGLAHHLVRRLVVRPMTGSPRPPPPACSFGCGFSRHGPFWICCRLWHLRRSASVCWRCSASGPLPSRWRWR